MSAHIRKLGFALAMLIWVVTGTSSVRAYSAGYCYCYNENNQFHYSYAWIYDYPSWNFVDEGIENNYYGYVGTHDASGPGPGNICYGECIRETTRIAQHLCDLYGDTDHNVQIQTWIHWEDLTDPNSSWTILYDTGSSVVMCSSI
jgi:hypothetical protein